MTDRIKCIEFITFLEQFWALKIGFSPLAVSAGIVYIAHHDKETLKTAGLREIFNDFRPFRRRKK